MILLHSLGYTHLDIKPENILLGKHYEAILADFGFSAKSVSDIY
jgi:serine/threonine protein kinase